MTYLLIALVALVVGGGFVFNLKRSGAIMANGVEADAVVSRVEDSSNDPDDWSHVFYATYQTPDGQTVEARLGNAPESLGVGDAVRVKYLPDKPKYALLIK